MFINQESIPEAEYIQEFRVIPLIRLIVEYYQLMMDYETGFNHMMKRETPEYKGEHDKNIARIIDKHDRTVQRLRLLLPCYR